MESSEVPSKGIKGLEKVKRGLSELGNYFKETFGVGPDKVPAEKIDQAAVAKVILYDTLAEGMRLGDHSQIPFSLTTLLDNMGHVVMSPTDNPREKFPDEYLAVRRQLDILVGDNILVIVPLKEPDSNGERLYYQVVNKDALKKIASKQSQK
ncbi:hypothetical protein HYT18_02220 [Candidatus Microgenomates bacterium]|nr:hypothetical protein [Candidatus Microgenomates bacterium]